MLLQDYLDRYREILEFRNLKPHSLSAMQSYLKRYLIYLEEIVHKAPEDMSAADIREFLKWLQSTRGLADRTINHAIAQLKCFTVYILNKPWDSKLIPNRKFDQFLPYVLNRDDAIEFIDTMTNIRAKAVTCLLYSAGLRIGEACSLRVKDIDTKNMKIHVHKTKNRSDRYVLLADHALEILRVYCKSYHIKKGDALLFPQTRDPKKSVSTETISRHIRLHKQALGWNQRITPHTFRHSFGSHLYEDTRDIFLIKDLLGHKSLRSTMIYVHRLADWRTRGVRSPFDSRTEA